MEPATAGRARFGAVRDGALQIVLEHDDLRPRGIRFLLRQQTGDIEIERRWPEDFSLSLDGDLHIGRISIPEASAFAPFSTVTVINDDGAPYDRGEDYHLFGLCAFDAEEAHQYYFTKPTRPKDLETQFFAGRQIRDHYRINDGSTKFVCVFFGYRALDLGDELRIREAIDWAEVELCSDQWRVDPHHRNNSQHQMLSLLMVKWQLHLALGENALVVALLDRAVEVARTIETFHGYYAYNSCRMILLRAYLHLVMKEKAITMELCEFNMAFYKQCCLQAAMRPILFKEMKEAHHAVYLGLELHQGIEIGRRLMKGEPVFQAVNRVKTQTALKRQEARFNDLLAWMRSNGCSSQPASRREVAIPSVGMQ